MIASQPRHLLRLIAQGESDERVRAELRLDREAFCNCLDQLFQELGVATRVKLMFFACSEEGKLLLERRAA